MVANILSPEDVRVFVAHVPEKWQAFFLVAITTGLRPACTSSTICLLNSGDMADVLGAWWVSFLPSDKVPTKPGQIQSGFALCPL